MPPPSGPQPCSIYCNTNSGPGPLNTDVLFRRSRGPHPIQVSIHLSSSRIFYGGAHCSIPQSSCVTTNGYLGPQSHRHEVRGIALQALATVLELDCTGLLSAFLMRLVCGTEISNLLCATIIARSSYLLYIGRHLADSSFHVRGNKTPRSYFSRLPDVIVMPNSPIFVIPHLGWHLCVQPLLIRGPGGFDDPNVCVTVTLSTRHLKCSGQCRYT